MNPLILTSILTAFVFSAMAQGPKRKMLPSHSEMVNCLAINSDGTYFASGSNDNHIKLFDEKGKQIKTWSAHGVGVRSLAFSPKDNLLVSGGRDGSIKIWSVPAAKLVGSLKGHKASVSGLAISSDGNTLYSTSDDRSLKKWNLKKNSLLTSIDCGQGRIQSLALSPDNKLVATGAGNKLEQGTNNLKVWDTKSGKEVFVLSDPEYAIMALDFIPESSQIIYGGIFKELKSLDYTSGEQKGAWRASNYGVHSLKVSTRGRWIYAGTTYDFNVLMISRSRGAVARLGSHTAYVNAVCLSPDETYLVSGDNEGGLLMWPLK